MNLKTGILIGALLLATCFVFGQNGKNEKKDELADSTEVNKLLDLSKENLNSDLGKAIDYGRQAMNLSYKIDFKKGKALAFKFIGIANYYQGNNLEALNFYNQSLSVFSIIGDDEGVANLQSNIGAIYLNQGDDARALDYFLQSLQRAEKIGNKLRILTALTNVGAVYAHYDSSFAKAIYYDEKAMFLAEELQNNDAIGTIAVNLGEIYAETNKDSLAMLYFKKSLKALGNSANSPASYNSIGALYLKQNDYALALMNHRKAYAIAEKLNSKLDIVLALQGLGRTYLKMNDNTSALRYFTEAVSIAKEIDDPIRLMKGYLDLSNAYASLGDYKNAHFSHVLYSDYKDTLYNSATDKKLAALQFDFDLQKKEGEITSLKKDNILRELELRRQRFTKNALILGLIMVFMLAFFVYRNSKQKQRANKKIEKAYEDLKATQSQLIQSEKMASLGELTAGIAHEIQNPLNFVNNFSEVNKELLIELKDKIDNGNASELKSIAEDVIQNEEKIIHHGKRAEAIVKGMLQHSRSSTGVKEPIDINALADEYLRLSYHGLRAKDKSFNAVIESDLDKTIGLINIIPQDIGRILLNLYNNAFYAVQEKNTFVNSLPAASVTSPYIPKVSVSTKKIPDKVEIRIKDNGDGISQKIVDKIFQPFFTTKPAGQGTGLGLSLSYDIIKAHGGEIKVETNEGKGSTFIIRLPIR
jgi:two-component system, NtrC family, sensor kinase